MATKKKKSKAKKPAKKKPAPKKKARLKKAAPKKKVPAKKPRARRKAVSVSTVPFGRTGRGASGGGQSGDLQGLSNTARSNSESVDELLEEGNAFEAEVVEGVEDAPDADEGEIRTREVPEGDVPDEYLDQDK